MTFYGLYDAVSEKLEGKFEGSVGWYYATVKLDLEARKLIERIPGSKPQIIRLVQEEKKLISLYGGIELA